MRLTSCFGVSKDYMHFKTKVQNRNTRWSSSHKVYEQYTKERKGLLVIF